MSVPRGVEGGNQRSYLWELSLGIHLVKDEKRPVLRPRVVANVSSKPEKAHHCRFVSGRSFVPFRVDSVFFDAETGARQATVRLFHGGNTTKTHGCKHGQERQETAGRDELWTNKLSGQHRGGRAPGAHKPVLE